MNKVVEATIQDYAPSSCLQLTTMMSTRLPRELRDMVYSYLLEDCHITMVHAMAHQVRFGDGRDACWDHETCSRMLPHLMDPGFVDEMARTELGEAASEIYTHKHTGRITQTDFNLFWSRFRLRCYVGRGYYWGCCCRHQEAETSDIDINAEIERQMALCTVVDGGAAALHHSARVVGAVRTGDFGVAGGDRAGRTVDATR
ncbi:hypothetical protein BDV95DRAFT_194632 [Massariosphaeria phaeospora]|uniref:Uncharacterized protein n=1 Tax=Massariosphaeria phaeospora TaxID=100035 RepID=A0A7C8MDG8_9PLEO|nr:hypothetical protein BDV95DRAFT_194632 [Massariosphaeria phaeospora]